MIDPFEHPDIFAEKVLRPARCPDDFVELLRGLKNPEEAWERLALNDCIPQAWVQDPERWFVWGQYANSPTKPFPDSIAACVTMACDVQGVLAAEALARDYLSRCRVWTDSLVQEISWRIVPRTWSAPATVKFQAHRPLMDAVDKALENFDDVQLDAAVLRVLFTASNPYAPQVRYELERASRWRYALACGRSVPAVKPFPEALHGRYFAEIADPFVPLLAVWGLGYAVEGVHNGRLVLTALTV